MSLISGSLGRVGLELASKDLFSSLSLESNVPPRLYSRTAPQASAVPLPKGIRSSKNVLNDPAHWRYMGPVYTYLRRFGMQPSSRVLLNSLCLESCVQPRPRSCVPLNAPLTKLPGGQRISKMALNCHDGPPIQVEIPDKAMPENLACKRGGAAKRRSMPSLPSILETLSASNDAVAFKDGRFYMKTTSATRDYNIAFHGVRSKTSELGSLSI